MRVCGCVAAPMKSCCAASRLCVSASTLVSQDLRDREDDIIWRVRWQDDWLYIYLIVEFQSTVYRYMAVRCMTYKGLLYEGLIRSQQLTSTRLLPPVVPIVIYNGRERWTA